MRTHIYAFGSVCRGEVDPGSDIDLLACLSKPNPAFDSSKFSIYKHERLNQLWEEGNPFSWHLHLESKLIYSSDGNNFLSDLGIPSKYEKALEDCVKFKSLFSESYLALTKSNVSTVFHLSCLFLAARNFATCYSLGLGKPVFSRMSPLMIDRKPDITVGNFGVFARARILSTRGIGDNISSTEIEMAKSSCPLIINWMDDLLSSVNLS